MPGFVGFLFRICEAITDSLSPTVLMCPGSRRPEGTRHGLEDAPLSSVLLTNTRRTRPPTFRCPGLSARAGRPVGTT
jgi:hypothetical protein